MPLAGSMRVYAGTSGYSYKEWKGKFYPEKLPANKMLGVYSTCLPTVEINNTFYRMPKAELLRNWGTQVGDDFRFSIKAPQQITHRKRLKDAEQETKYLFESLEALGDKLGIVLFQLPPHLRADPPLLKNFLELLPQDIPCAFEFRHTSWSDDAVYTLLQQHDKTLCIADSDKTGVQEMIATSDIGYLRLRRTDYNDDEIKTWADRLHQHNWKSVYVFFKHEDDAGGPHLAQALLDRVNNEQYPQSSR